MMLLREDLRGALNRLDVSGLRPRLYKVEMVLLQMMLARELHQPCLRLWAEDWNLTPMQKYVILKSFWSALFLNIPRVIGEHQFAMIPVFTAIRTLPHAKGIIERLALALGNQEAEARLSSYPAVASTVQRCRVNNRSPLSPIRSLADYPRWAVPTLGPRWVPPVPDPRWDAPPPAAFADLGLPDRLDPDHPINRLGPRRIPVNFRNEPWPASVPFPGDSI